MINTGEAKNRGKQSNSHHPISETVGHIFEGLSGAQIMHSISLFEAWEVRSPKLQTVFDLELKRRSYGRLKTTVQN